MADGGQWADMCSGTGEMAAYLNHLAPKGARIYATDFSLPMLEEAKRKPEAERVNFVASDIKALPFPNESFDLVTMSKQTHFGSELRRVLPTLKTRGAFRKSGNQQTIIFAC